MPKVSIVLPTFNRAHTIERPIRSIQNQSFDDWELIIVDDGSTDSTEEIVSRYSSLDDRITYNRVPNGGAPRARNVGIDIARGEFIAFQDSDDEWHPEFLRRMLENSNLDTLTWCSFELQHQSGFSEQRPAYTIKNTRKQLRRENFISTQTVVMPRRLLEDARFDERLPRLQDWDLWLSLAGQVKFRHIEMSLARLYVQDDSLSMNIDGYFVALRLIVKKHAFELMRSPHRSASNFLKAAIGRPIGRRRP